MSQNYVRNLLSITRIWMLNRAINFELFLSISILFLGVSFYLVWVFVGYARIYFTDFVSFRADDGWCSVPGESIFTHCFGDYAVLSYYLKEDRIPWLVGDPMSSFYPASSWIPAKIFHEIGLYFENYNLGRNLFLIALSVSLLFPAINAMKGKGVLAKFALFSVIGISSTPFLITLDRGNSIGLSIAPLTLAILALTKNRPEIFSPLVILAALIKPQLALFFLLLLAVAKYRLFFISIFLYMFFFFASFTFFPGVASSNIRNWFLTIVKYSSYQELTDLYPINLSLDRTLLTVLQVANFDSEQISQNMISTLGILGNLLMLLIILLLIYRRDSKANVVSISMLITILIITISGISYAYYLIILLVPISFILKDLPNDSRSSRAEIPNQISRFSKRETLLASFDKLVLLLTSLILAPLYFPIKFFPNLQESLVLSDSSVNVFQVFWGPVLSLIFILVAIGSVFNYDYSSIKKV